MNALWVFLGGGVGSLLRFAAGASSVATWAVNVVGCTAMGALMASSVASSAPARFFWATGVLGGLTTYSTFNQQVLDFVRVGRGWSALIYASATLGACALCGALGYGSMRWLFR
ncbi:MAG: fluoride efflux transporter FluC [Myxococcaceae bacterium]